VLKESQCKVLLADDSAEDLFFLTRAIETAAPSLCIVGQVRDGDEVIDYLTGSGVYANREQYPLPDLLIIDWRMNRKGGRETLEWLKSHPVPNLKVAVLADSSGMQHQSHARELGADFFFSKTMGSAALNDVARTLQQTVLRQD
jgi:CheY-like chemotaxis protein